jgi:hypothetical protein
MRKVGRWSEAKPARLKLETKPTNFLATLGSIWKSILILTDSVIHFRSSKLHLTSLWHWGSDTAYPIPAPFPIKPDGATVFDDEGHHRVYILGSYATRQSLLISLLVSPPEPFNSVRSK